MRQKLNRSRVAKATVTLLEKGGQGVLVNGNLILTAAHCVDFTCDGSMALGDDRIHHIATVHGKLQVIPVALEPVNDVAVLGSLDSSRFPPEAEEFEAFCDQTEPIPLCLTDAEPSQSFRVHIYTHRRTWVTGNARLCQEGANCLWVEVDEQIEGGTSGGPIVNESGELVGIVSTAGTQRCDGMAPRPHLALPVWVCHRILS